MILIVYIGNTQTHGMNIYIYICVCVCVCVCVYRVSLTLNLLNIFIQCIGLHVVMI